MSADSTSSAITKKSTWKPPQLPLKATDSLLIGFAGVALTVANPAFWSGSLFSVTDVQLLPPFFYLLGLLMNVYSIVIPGAVMWPLTVRRTNSHDFYDLFKPSLACFACLLIPLAVVLALKTDYTVLVMQHSAQDVYLNRKVTVRMAENMSDPLRQLKIKDILSDCKTH